MNNYLHKSQIIINNHNIIKNSQLWCLLGRTSGGFAMLIFILLLLLFFICRFSSLVFFSTSSLTLPRTIARFLDPFCIFSPAHRRVICDTFIFQPFHYLLTASATVLSGHFLPTGVFYLTLLPKILAQPAFIKVLLGAGSYFLESCRASYWCLKHRPGTSVCLIHSNPQPSIHLNFAFMHVNIAKVLLVVKTLTRSAATLFSNPGNIKQ